MHILFDNYQMAANGNCYIANFSHLMKNYGINISESELFLSGNGLQLLYKPIISTKSLSELKFSFDCESSVKNFLLRYDIAMQKRSIDGDISRFIKQSIDCQTPLIIWVNSKFLDYYPKELEVNRDHIITVIGYDDDSAVIADCFIPTLTGTSTFIGKFSFEKLKIAMSKMQFTYYSFDLQSFIKQALNTKQSTIDNVIRENIIQHLNEDESKLMCFAQEISHFRETFSEEDIKTNCDNLFFTIKYIGIIFSRQMLAEYFSDKTHGIDSIAKLNEVIKRWEGVNYSLFKYNLTLAQKSKYLLLSDKLRQLVIDDTSLLRSLINSKETTT